jgi:hypothetical protein
MTMTANSTSALKCEANTFDLDSPSTTCNHKVLLPLSPTASMMSTAPNTPEAQANIKEKMIPALPAEIQTADFSDSDDEEGLPGYPSWGSSWSMRALRTPESTPVAKSAKSPTSSGTMLNSFHLDNDTKVSEDDEQ